MNTYRQGTENLLTVEKFKGLISPPSEPPGEIMSFGVSPVNYSDSGTSWVKYLLTNVDARHTCDNFLLHGQEIFSLISLI